jgi:hypothetical protein
MSLILVILLLNVTYFNKCCVTGRDSYEFTFSINSVGGNVCEQTPYCRMTARSECIAAGCNERPIAN